jgi:hypothetical protein
MCVLFGGRLCSCTVQVCALLHSAYPALDEFLLNQKYPVVKHALRLNWIRDYDGLADDANFRASRFYGDTTLVDLLGVLLYAKVSAVLCCRHAYAG